MSKVDDVLQGQRTGLVINDIVAVTTHIVNTSVVAQPFYLQTTNATLPAAPVDLGHSFAYPLNNSKQGEVAVEAGRFFTLPYQTLLAFHSASGNNGTDWAVNIKNIKTGEADTGNSFNDTGVNDQSDMQVFVGDFTGAGLDQALLVYELRTSNSGDYVIKGTIAAANDPKDWKMGVKFADTRQSFESLHGHGKAPIAIGDFIGDGKKEIAYLKADGATIDFYGVDPNTLELKSLATVTLPTPVREGGAFAAAIVAGHFVTPAHDDLVVAGKFAGDKDLNIQSVRITPNPDRSGFSAQPTGELQKLATTDNKIIKVLGQAAALSDPTGVDNLVLIADQSSPWLFISGADAGLTFQLLAENHPLGGNKCTYTMKVGNFDQKNTDGDKTPNLVPYIATYENRSSSCDTGGDRNPSVQIYYVTPNQKVGQDNSWISGQSAIIRMPHEDNVTDLTMAAGDIQGRTMYLGDPTKITITDSIQPDLVLGMPPMHADWIDTLGWFTDQGCHKGQPCLADITTYPTALAPAKGFSTYFNWQLASSKNRESTSTTSWSLGVDISAYTKYVYGNLKTGGFEAGLKFNTSYLHESKVAKTFNTYRGVSHTFNVNTGLSDYVTYSAQRHNLYIYPILGRTACPPDKPDCSDDEKKPVVATFSVPDNVSRTSADGSELEWYQPVHEPANLFSYPWTLNQLRAEYGAKVFSQVPADVQDIGTFTKDYTTSWAGANQEQNTTWSSNSFSVGLDFTFDGTIPLVGSKLKVGGEVDVHGSGAWTNLNVGSQSLAASQGILVNKPTFPSDTTSCCRYGFSSYILGVEPFDQTPQSRPKDLGAGLNATGPMFVTFNADILGPRSPWWQLAYPLPDIGLSHPLRWNWDSYNRKLSFNNPGTDKPLVTDPFYTMRGFFITPNHGSETLGGPTVGVVKDGQPVNLTVRVYNFSMTGTPGNATITALFYRQEYDSKQLIGDSVFIGSKKVDPIPGYQETNLPNYTYTTIPFDTTGLAGKRFLFWVAVYMVDKDGRLLPEMPDHGLTALPRQDYTSIKQVPIESHSNNIGLFGVQNGLTVIPAQPSEAASSAVAASSAGEGRLEIQDVTLPPGVIELGKRTELDVALSAPGATVEGGSLTYYDGDPARGGTSFGLIPVSYVGSGETRNQIFFYRPKACGVHNIYVVANTPGANQASKKFATATVTVDAASSINTLLTIVGQAHVSPDLASPLRRALTSAGYYFAKGERQKGALLLQYVGALAGSSDATKDQLGKGAFLTDYVKETLGCLGFSPSVAPPVAQVQSLVDASESVQRK